jgi:glutamate/tyrosine decarboxylase-like PLP-dependent enzyme
MTETLFPPPSRREAIEPILSLILCETRHASVVPTLDMEAFRHQLARFDFAQTDERLPEAMIWVTSQLRDGLVHVTHPRYFGLFNPKPTWPSMIADRIIAEFNPQLATHTTSPVAVEIETHTINHVAARLGLPEGASGHFTSGGSEANYTALLLALLRAKPDYATDGALAFAGNPTFYVSADSHLAWVKIALMAGIGKNAVQMIATIDGVMDTAALRAQIVHDRHHGFYPVMIVATAGTTGVGMIDPLQECKAIADDFDLWFHVDAAWGGAIVASDKHRAVLDGIGAADSVTVDGHKWFATTMGCGMFLTRDTTALQAFRVSTYFMPSQHMDDPYVTSVQWSRPFRGLRLFLTLAAVGWAGIATHVEHCLERGDLLCQMLKSSGWQVVNQSKLGIHCFVPPSGEDARRIVNNVLASGKAWVSVTSFAGREVIRACVTSGETTEQDIGILVDELRRAAREAGVA